jgi:hypothetical protein
LSCLDEKIELVNPAHGPMLNPSLVKSWSQYCIALHGSEPALALAQLPRVIPAWNEEP